MQRVMNFGSGLRIAGAALALGSAAITSGSQGKVRLVSYSAGDVIPVRMNTELSSANSRSGDRFTADVDSDQRGYGFFRGATVDGVVTGVRAHEGNRPGSLSLSFLRIHSAGGRTFKIEATAISLDKSNFKQRDDGKLVAKPGEKKQYLEFAGIGAGAGAVAGIITGHGLKLGNVLIGAAIGAGAAQASKGKKVQRDLVLKKGSKLGVLLSRPLDYKPD